MASDNGYKAAYEREKQARLKAEAILEAKSRELFQKNQRLQESYDTLQKQQTAVLQNDKLATLGTLAAGMAHEINNPLAFVKSNIESLAQYHTSYAKLVELTQTLLPQMDSAQQDSFKQLLEDEDIAFVQEDLPELMSDTFEGLARVKDIVANLRSFAQKKTQHSYQADLIESLESTLKLLQGSLKHSVALNLDLQPLPKILCNLGDINQVFMNLIMNAKQAVSDTQHPTIWINSSVQQNMAQIRFADNGCGIDANIIKDIFTPFFTTKAVGEGTGMGLAIAYRIVQDHGGEIEVNSRQGEGSEFIVKLPITDLN